MKNTVIIQFDIEGFHFYNGAPIEVSFLENNHRHTFTVKAGYLVNDINREREIFICRDEIKDYLFEAYGVPCQFKGMSCEMIDKEILEFAMEDGMIWCEVWEELTGGARVEI